MAKHLYTYINPVSEKDMDEACRVLEAGGVIAYPTDVNWALGCDAANTSALKRLRAIKSEHPKEQPFSLICHSIAMISEVAQLDNFAYRAVKKALPGPFTILLPRSKNLSKQIHDKRTLVGVRVPNCPLLLELVRRFGRPIVTSSLPHGERPELPALRFGYEVEMHYGHCLELILDLGEELEPNETTIVDLSEGSCQLIRRGLGDPSLLGLV